MRELNLLPPSRRRLLSWRVVTRALNSLVVVVCVALLVISAIGAAAVTWFTLTASRSMSTQLTHALEEYQHLRTSVAERNTQIQLLDRIESQRIEWAPLVSALIRVIPPGVTIDHLAVNTDSSKLNLAGVATNRAALVVFERQLRALPWAVTVTAPPTNLLQRQNPRYAFDITIRAPASDAATGGAL